MKTQILVDRNSWAVPYAKELKEKIEAELIFSEEEIKPGDLMIILSWEKIIKKEVLDLHKNNIVVHASNLPKGKGMSPLTWQVLEGKNNIPITMFEVVEEMDAGDVYLKSEVIFEGHELIDEMREKLGRKINEMILRFIKKDLKAQKQTGESSYYKRRKPEDSEIDPNKTLKESFNILRVVDNERYPAFFNHKGHKYIIKIFKDE